MRVMNLLGAAAISLLIGAGFAGLTTAEETWTQWRGPNRDGRIAKADWPDSLDEEHLKQAWRVELPPSYSGPIVSRDTVFTTATKDAEQEVVYALDRKTGEEKWQAAWKGSMIVPFFAWSNGSWIRSTPVLDDGKLYVAGMRDVLVCLDATTGKEIWRLDFVKELETPLPSFGFVCSPLIMGDYLYVQAGAGFCKVQKSTGKIVWRTLEDDGGMYGSAFSSPSFAEIQDQPQLLVQTRKELCGVAPDSGNVLWKREIEAFRGMNILTPLVIENSVFTSAYGGKTHLFDVKTDEGEASKLKLAENWTNKVQGYMSSPILYEGHIYLHLKNQRFTCIDAKTGETKWTTKPFGKYWSMVGSGDKILALDERGDLLLIRATPEKFDLLSERHISDATAWAHLTICGDEIFVRDLTGLTAFSWK